MSSEDPSTRVLVLEAAGRYRFDVFITAGALSFPIGSRFYDWQYESEPSLHEGPRIYHARGKVLGGSAAATE